VAAPNTIGNTARKTGQPRAVPRIVEERVQDVTTFRAPAMAGAGRPVEVASPRVERVRVLFEATPGGWSDRVGRRIGHRSPAFAVGIVMISAYAALTVVLVASGLLFTHVVVHGGIGRWDDHVNEWFVRHRDSFWNQLSADATLVANTLGVVVVGVLVTVVLLLRRWGRNAMLILVGLAVELAAFLSTTYVVARPRPRVPHLGGTPSTFSWPSGHTAATFVLYGSIAVLVSAATRRRAPRIAAWAVAVALTVAVSLSRIYRGEHHPTDTVAALVLGIGVLLAAVFALRAGGAAKSARIIPPVRDPVVSAEDAAPPLAASR
jgi:membrane-associated phospholipid phosphatase